MANGWPVVAKLWANVQVDVRKQCGFPEGVPPEFYVRAARSTQQQHALVSLVLEETSDGYARIFTTRSWEPAPDFRVYSKEPYDRHGVDAYEIPFADLPITHGWDARTVGNARKVRFESGYSRYWASFASAGDAQDFQKATYLAWQRVMVRMGLDYN